MSHDIGAAYDAAADGWRAGPARMYGRLAEAMADHAPVPLDGARVLDAGAGTGVAGRALRARGAREVVALDLAPGMLPRPPALSTVGDLQRIPFRDGSFDLAAAAFSLNHFADPTPAAIELRRVAGALLATAFAPGWDHPAKEAIDAVMVRRGFDAPDWYRTFKAAGGDGDPGPAELEDLARRAGFAHAEAQVLEVDSGLRSPADLVDWRIGMAHLAPFAATLAPDALAEARAEAEAAVEGMPSLVVAIVVLSAR
ncbi:class I SAM-dependent methyltransferase [Nocardioides stalactiti]|uniref:class I SAM-dependent methyltransferase n=1 Tax=Nocardioides stalactiti TaxID=2755356 RepID=UPI00160347BA|nr:class I SAM-dependent methyltransferase [Nocardioides stalactiti]